MQTGDKGAIGFVFGVLILALGVMVATRSTRELPPTTSAGAVDVATLPRLVTISRGEEVEIPPFLEPGKATIVEFGAEW